MRRSNLCGIGGEGTSLQAQSCGLSTVPGNNMAPGSGNGKSVSLVPARARLMESGLSASVITINHIHIPGCIHPECKSLARGFLYAKWTLWIFHHVLRS